MLVGYVLWFDEFGNIIIDLVVVEELEFELFGVIEEVLWFKEVVLEEFVV